VAGECSSIVHAVDNVHVVKGRNVLSFILIVRNKRAFKFGIEISVVAAFFIESSEVLKEYRHLMGCASIERSYCEQHSKSSKRRSKRQSIIIQQKAVARWLGPWAAAQKILYKWQLRKKQKRSLAGLNYISNHRKAAKVAAAIPQSNKVNERMVDLSSLQTGRITIAQQVAEAYAAFQKERLLKRGSVQSSQREDSTVGSTDESSSHHHSASIYPSLNSLLNRMALGGSPSKEHRIISERFAYDDIYLDKETRDIRVISRHSDIFEVLKREHVQLLYTPSPARRADHRRSRDESQPKKHDDDHESPLKLHQSREAALAKLMLRRGDEVDRKSLRQQSSSDDVDPLNESDLLTPVRAPPTSHRDGDLSSQSTDSRRSDKRISITEQVAAAYRQVSAGKLLPVTDLKLLASSDSGSTEIISKVVESTGHPSISIASQVATAYLQVETGKRLFDQYKGIASRHDISLLSLHKLTYDLGYYMSLGDITQSLSSFARVTEGTIRYSDYITWWSRLEMIR